MFDVFTKIVELLLNITKPFQENQNLRRKRKLGQSLVTLYLRLLEVIYTARRIIGELEYFEQRFSEHIEKKDNWFFLKGNLNADLKKQSLNLFRLNHAIRSVYSELLILLPDVTLGLSSLFDLKVSTISQLADLLASGRYPMRFDPDEPSTEEDISIELDWGQEVYKALTAHLASDKPRQSVRELEKCAIEIRKLLLENFKLEDILWGVDKFHD